MLDVQVNNRADARGSILAQFRPRATILGTRASARAGGEEAQVETGADSGAKAFVVPSVLLQRLHDEAPRDHVTLGWLMSRMNGRSFGRIMLLLAVVAIAPVSRS
ncbi:exopolysaccharide biosynthesis protein [Rhodopseudomonas sp. RCAM05734]|uniref:exopolysaccharide biosynthesis protein n=1 Tax=Rhodopseudomonas sp. RCAM05734 TaxID=3457549 RepID=UPI00404459BB